MNEIEKRMLPCKLTEREREQKTIDLVRLEQDEAAQKAAKKLAMSKMTSALKAVREDIDEVVKQLDENSELREVEVEAVPRPEEGIVEYVRLDTQEVVGSRMMELFDRDEEAQKARKKARRKHGNLTAV